MLQEYAYHLCRQIYSGDNDPGQKTCRERARVVLLGVNLFGGKSFAHEHNSTYFEFDPFPQRANDYVAARLVKHPLGMAPTEAPLVEESNLWTFYFKEGWMIMRNYPGGQPSNRFAIPFLREQVPVPPSMVRAPESDRFVWLARRSLGNTEVSAFMANATNPKEVTDRLRAEMANVHDKKGDARTSTTLCQVHSDKNQLVQGFAAQEFDCNTSITKAITLECPDGSIRTMIVTLGHTPSSKEFPETPRRTLSEECADMSSELGLVAMHLGRGTTPRSTYRFVQNGYPF
jgi:hypothetical protein